MRQTLFLIPHQIAGWPVFGFGWALWGWCAGSALLLAWLVRRQGWNAETRGFLPFMAMLGLVFWFVLPAVELKPGDVLLFSVSLGPEGMLDSGEISAGLKAAFSTNNVPLTDNRSVVVVKTGVEWQIDDGTKHFTVKRENDRLNISGDVVLGLPIRGYGMMLLLAVMTGVGLAVYRARQVGLNPDLIYSLAFTMFVGGIVGARLFFVMEYWSEMRGPTWFGTVRNVLNFVQGGLVVYGSLIGAGVSAVWFLQRRGLSILAVGDLIAPSLAIGLAIGRLGCLMNGCCYGGLCDQPWAITFPAKSWPAQLDESPPYQHQHRQGILHGIRIDRNSAGQVIVAEVYEHGAAAQSNLKPGATIQTINGYRIKSLADAEQVLGAAGPEVELETDQGRAAWSLGELPDRSRPVQPTQVLAAINAGLLALLSFAFYPFRRRDGQVIALLFTLYSVSRFLLEILRVDEGSFLGTGLTISQNVSIALFLLAGGIWLYGARRGPETAELYQK